MDPVKGQEPAGEVPFGLSLLLFKPNSHFTHPESRPSWTRLPPPGLWYRFFSSCCLHLVDTDVVVAATLVMLVWLKKIKCNHYLLFILLHFAHCISHMARLSRTFVFVWMKPLSQSAPATSPRMPTDVKCRKYVWALRNREATLCIYAKRMCSEHSQIAVCFIVYMLVFL